MANDFLVIKKLFYVKAPFSENFFLECARTVEHNYIHLEYG